MESMESLSLSLIMDLILLAFLGIATYYMFRVTRALSAFRSHRQDFLRLMGELSNNIGKAQATIENMKKTGQGEGRQLQELIDQARLAADELQLINETSNSMARRLEGLAGESRKAVQGRNKSVNGAQENKTGNKPARTKEGFFIQDREFEEAGQDSDQAPDWAMDEAGVPDGLQSRAERELFQALQRNRNTN